MVVNEEDKRRIIDLYFNQGKTIREVSRIMGKSSHDITPVTKEHRIQLAQNYTLAKGKQSDVVQHEQDRVISNVKAYKLFDKGKNPLEVSAQLNLPGPQVQQFYVEYWKLKHMHQLFNVYQEIQNTIGYFLKLVRLGKKEGLTPEQIIIFIQMADKIHDLKEKFQHLQSEVVDIGIRKSVGKEQLKDLHKGIEAAQEKLNSADRAFKVKYGELTETCSQIQKLENYLEKLKGGQNYQELEAIVRNKVGEILADNKKLLQNALASVIVALRHDPDRYLLIDRMELTPFTTSTIVNYDSFLALGRH